MAERSNPWTENEELVDVGIIDMNGDRYEFPNVIWKSLWPIIRSETLLEMTTLCFANTAKACLLVPVTNVKSLLINGQVYWTRPSTH